MTEVLGALEGRNMVKLRPPVREGQKAQWDALTGALLMHRCDLIVKRATDDGIRYERVRYTATSARMTRQLAGSSIEYVLRTSAATPKWATEE